MHIKKLEITNLYGYLNRTIDFKDRLSILVGPNGSGKTTILNVINWVLSPDLTALCTTEYSEICLYFEYNKQDFFIQCKKEIGMFSYNLKINEEHFHPLEVNLTNIYRDFPKLTPEKNEMETWDRIQSLPKPLFIGLDRLIFSLENDIKYSEKTVKGAKSKESPINRATSMVKDHFIKQNAYIINLTKELNNNLILSNFHSLITIDNFTDIIRPDAFDITKTEKEISDLHKRINHYLISFSGVQQGDIDKSAFDSYFKDLISSLHLLVDKTKSEDEKKVLHILTVLNLHSFKRLKGLMNDFDKFENRINTIMYRIDLFLKSINFFLQDTGKKLFIDKNNGDLKVQIIGNRKSQKKHHIELDKLSSGEQQLIVILAYLIFYTSKDQLFLIDEPELSLHVKWQENLLKTLNEANGQNNQILVCTHSPLIVGSFRENTITIRNKQNEQYIN